MVKSTIYSAIRKIFHFFSAFILALLKLEIKISFFVVNFFFLTKFGYALYIILTLWLTILQTPGLVLLEGTPALKAIYGLSFCTFTFIAESAIETMIIYNIPPLKKRIESWVGISFMERTMGNEPKGRLVIKAFFPFYLFLFIDSLDFQHAESLKAQAWEHYLNDCYIEKKEISPEEVHKIFSKSYSIIGLIREKIRTFF